MEFVASSLTILAVVALGVSAGALIAEGAVLVPFWRSLSPESFLAWYREHAGLLLRFFGPLEIAASVLALCALGSNWVVPRAGTTSLFVSALLAVAVLAAFPLYFQRVNARFAAGAIERERVPGELHRWSRWHWARTALALGAFFFAALALTACDISSPTSAPVAACSETGAQCQLPNGPLGVCERSPCEAGLEPPCHRCTPQH